MPVFRQLRYELQVRKDRLFRVDCQALIDELKLFFEFLRTNPLLSGLLQELRTNMPDFKTAYDQMAARRRILWPTTENERVKLCLSFLEYCSSSNNQNEPFNIAYSVGFTGRTVVEGSHFFLEQFLMPFYEYLDQHIEEYSSVLYIIEKFKLRAQWFERARLFDLFNADPSRGEAVLDKQLREFLFDNGVEYPFSTPASASGRADIVASLHTPDPVIIEVKIFDGESRGRAYIRQGVTQISKYVSDYNKHVGYLVIFNVCDRELRFSLRCPDKPSRINFENKTIFLIDIDIYHDIQPASERPPLTIYGIKEDELFSTDSVS
jgi:hypothetical protein